MSSARVSVRETNLATENTFVRVRGGNYNVGVIRCAFPLHVFSVRDNLYSPVELKYLTRMSADINIGKTRKSHYLRILQTQTT